MNQKTVVSLGLFIVTAIGFAVLLVNWKRDAASQLAKVQKEVESLKNVASDPIHDVRTVVRERETVKVVNAGSPDVSPSGMSEPKEHERTPEEIEYRTGVILSAQAQALADGFVAESIDPDWSPTAKAKLDQTFSGDSFRDWTVETECRTTMCRIHIKYTDDGHLPSGGELTLRMPWPGGLSSRVDMETHTALVYLARQEMTLPRVDIASLQF